MSGWTYKCICQCETVRISCCESGEVRVDGTRVPRFRGESIMRIGRKTAQKESRQRGLARAALDGAPRDELSREALQALTRHGHKDRLGVRLQADPNSKKNDRHEGAAAHPPSTGTKTV